MIRISLFKKNLENSARSTFFVWKAHKFSSAYCREGHPMLNFHNSQCYGKTLHVQNENFRWDEITRWNQCQRVTVKAWWIPEIILNLRWFHWTQVTFVAGVHIPLQQAQNTLNCPQQSARGKYWPQPVNAELLSWLQQLAGLIQTHAFWASQSICALAQSTWVQTRWRKSFVSSWPTEEVLQQPRYSVGHVSIWKMRSLCVLTTAEGAVFHGAPSIFYWSWRTEPLFSGLFPNMLLSPFSGRTWHVLLESKIPPWSCLGASDHPVVFLMNSGLLLFGGRGRCVWGEQTTEIQKRKSHWQVRQE